MTKRRGWRSGGVSAACFTCRSGNAALHSAMLRPSVGALWPTPVSAHTHTRLCVNVYISSQECILSRSATSLI